MFSTASTLVIAAPQQAFKAVKTNAENVMALAAANWRKTAELGFTQLSASVNVLEALSPVSKLFSDTRNGFKGTGFEFVKSFFDNAGYQEHKVILLDDAEYEALLAVPEAKGPTVLTQYGAAGWSDEPFAISI